ncbi:hypothetical protein [Pueribacillus theae]|uniref:hypothetical protein n=1 Tax=Pueribacillus theae TaxID=2171751 RepID=UPI001402DC2A|nr:hypothetical protein [Pueribacillus theae]
MILTYRACKTLIDRKTYESKEDMQTKLDIFLLNNRLTQAEYDELTQQLSAA